MGADGGGAVHLFMSVGTLAIGLLLTLGLDLGPELRPFGWLIVAVGVLGIAARFALPALSRRGNRPPGP